MWTAPDRFKAIRLLGKQPLDAVDDTEVAQIFLAAAKLCPDPAGGSAFAPLASELDPGASEIKIYRQELRKRRLRKLMPPDADSARRFWALWSTVTQPRLRLVFARNQEIAEADAAEAPNRLAFDPSPAGDKLRRYVLSAARLVNQTIKTYLSAVSGQLSAHDQDAQAAIGPADGGPLDPVARNEANVTSSVVRGPLPVGEVGAHAAAGRADGGLLDPVARNRSQRDFVRCPSSVAR